MLRASAGLFKPVSSLPRLSGPALVVGSGPGTRLPEQFDDSWTLATVNGSQTIATRLGCGRPDLTLLGTSVLKNNDVNLEAQAVLRGGSTGTLICINDRRWYSLARFRRAHLRLARLGYTFDQYCQFNRVDRLRYISSVMGERIGVDLKPSNGVALAFLCLHLGASFVVMTGFSLTRNGHAYNDKNRPRLHAEEDRKLLKLAVAKGVSIYTSQPGFAEESGIPLYTEKVLSPIFQRQ